MLATLVGEFKAARTQLDKKKAQLEATRDSYIKNFRDQR